MINSMVWIVIAAVILLAASRWIEQAHRRFPFARVLGGGWVLLALGIVVGPQVTGIMPAQRIEQLQPILLILLTWIGIIVGLQCRAVLIRAIPTALWRWMSFDFALSILLSIVAGGVIARIMQPDSPTAAHILLSGTIAAIAIGWNPETRSLGIRNDVASKRLSILVQGGAGGLAIAAIAMASLALQCAYEDSSGTIVFAPWGGMLALAMEIGAVVVVALGAHEILRDTREDDARTSLIVIGALCLLSGVAVSFGGSALLTGMLFGATIAMSSRRLRGLEHLIVAAEPMVASGCFFFAGVTLALPATITTLSGAVMLGTIALVLALARWVIKPLIMTMALASIRSTIALDSPAGRAPIRQAPLTIVILLAFAIQDSSGIADQLLAFAVLIALLSVALACVPPRSARSTR